MKRLFLILLLATSVQAQTTWHLVYSGTNSASLFETVTNANVGTTQTHESFSTLTGAVARAVALGVTNSLPVDINGAVQTNAFAPAPIEILNPPAVSEIHLTDLGTGKITSVAASNNTLVVFPGQNSPYSLAAEKSNEVAQVAQDAADAAAAGVAYGDSPVRMVKKVKQIIDRYTDTFETNIVCDATGSTSFYSATVNNINWAGLTIVGQPVRFATLVGSGTKSNQVTFQLWTPAGAKVATVETNRVKVGILK